MQFNLTSLFPIQEPQNPWIDVFYEVQERLATDYKATKLGKGSSGKSSTMDFEHLELWHWFQTPTALVSFSFLFQLTYLDFPHLGFPSIFSMIEFEKTAQTPQPQKAKLQCINWMMISTALHNAFVCEGCTKNGPGTFCKHPLNVH